MVEYSACVDPEPSLTKNSLYHAKSTRTFYTRSDIKFGVVRAPGVAREEADAGWLARLERGTVPWWPETPEARRLSAAPTSFLPSGFHPAGA